MRYSINLLTLVVSVVVGALVLLKAGNWSMFEFLEVWKQAENYQIGTGLGLLFVVIAQWSLTAAKGVFNLSGAAWDRMLLLHYMLGLVSPILAFMHSAKLGYGLLGALIALFLLNAMFGSAMGLANEAGTSSRRFAIKWSVVQMVPIHIALSSLVAAMLLVHIWNVIYFN